MLSSALPSADMSPSGKLVLIIGPSGVGKSVILKRLKQRRPEVVLPRSATTRPRREGEGDDLYHFVSDEEFDRMIARHELLEWASVHSGPRYGTVLSQIIPAIEDGKVVVREVDVQGFDSIRTHPLFSGTSPPYRLQSIFILPESKQQLIAHIEKRAPIAKEELRRRLESMDREMEYAKLCDATVTSREGKLDDVERDIEELILGGS